MWSGVSRVRRGWARPPVSMAREFYNLLRRWAEIQALLGNSLSMSLRKVFFWLHLTSGVVAGPRDPRHVRHGTLLTYEKQVTRWADGYRRAPAPGATRLPIETLLAKVRETRSALPASVMLEADPAAPATLGYGREGTLFVDPYDGTVLGEGSSRARAFFRSVTDWHRWLSASGDNRARGKAVTGAANLVFLFIVMSGFYLWWPRSWTWRSLRAVTWFQGGLPGKARDFNWHNVIGFWRRCPSSSWCSAGS